MGSPTDDYLARRSLVASALHTVNLGGIEAKFEQPKIEDNGDFGDDFSGNKTESFSTLPPGRVAFYEGETKVGELHYSGKEMELKVLDKSFKPYETALRAALGL